MAKLKWDQTGEKRAETGVDQAVLYVMRDGEYQTGVAWNGLISVSESPTGGEPTPFYANNRKYLEIMSEEEFAGSLGCYMYPDEFQTCIGEEQVAPGFTMAQQIRTPFGLVYRTKIVNDTDGVEHGYKIHVVYGARAGVSERTHTTINESPELEELTYDFTTTKVELADGRLTSHLVFDSTKLEETDGAAAMATLLGALYGSDGTPGSDPRLPTPDEILEFFNVDNE